MAGNHVEELFEEFAVAFARGEEPDVGGLLAQAGDGADELARMIDAYLAHAVPSQPAEEQVELMRAWARGQSPLVALRARRGLKRPDVVRELLARLGLPAAAEGKVGRYLHELEAGALDPARVDRRVWDALAGLLGADVRRLASLRPRRLGAAQPAFYREPTGEAGASATAAAPSPAEPDEVDRLFTGGPESGLLA
jgi:hypothetical protein